MTTKTETRTEAGTRIRNGEWVTLKDGICPDKLPDWVHDITLPVPNLYLPSHNPGHTINAAEPWVRSDQEPNPWRRSKGTGYTHYVQVERWRRTVWFREKYEEFTAPATATSVIKTILAAIWLLTMVGIIGVIVVSGFSVAVTLVLIGWLVGGVKFAIRA